MARSRKITTEKKLILVGAAFAVYYVGKRAGEARRRAALSNSIDEAILANPDLFSF